MRVPHAARKLDELSDVPDEQRIGVMLAGKGGALACGAILFSKEYGFLCETEGAEELLKQIREG